MFVDVGDVRRQEYANAVIGRCCFVRVDCEQKMKKRMKYSVVWQNVQDFAVDWENWPFLIRNECHQYSLVLFCVGKKNLVPDRSSELLD